MKFFFLFTFFLLLLSCGKPKTVLICGDHICVNNDEAEQYFEDNLSLEVRIINKKQPKKLDLVELNLKSIKGEKREVNISSIIDTNKNIKILSNSEIEEKKRNLKKRKKDKKVIINQNKIKHKKVSKLNKKNISNNNLSKVQKPVNNKKQEIVDICKIIEKCSIDEISKYLIKQGAKNKFPDITTRE